MILNTYAILDAFLSLLRGGLGLLVLWLGVSAWWTWLRRPPGPEGRKELEDRFYLLFLLAGLLLALNVLSWPLFYLLLQSYVPEWGVMCIYGVTRIGVGTIGSSRFLPPLVTALQALKPILIFLSGAWFVLYLVNRRTQTAPLTGRVLLLLLIAGGLAIGDAAAELTYLAIPKKEVKPSAGCCTEVFDAEDGTSRFLPGALGAEGGEKGLFAAYYGVHGALVLALVMAGMLFRRRLRGRWLAPLLLAAALAVVVNAVFLVEIVAPHLLRHGDIPAHRCPYCLVPQAPEGLVAAGLSLGASFAIGWACIAAWLGSAPGAKEYLPGTVGVLLRLALFGYFWSVVMTSVELALP